MFGVWVLLVSHSVSHLLLPAFVIDTPGVFSLSVIQVGVLPLVVGWVYIDVLEWFSCFFVHPRRGPCSYSDGF